jgi:hypothetical protein
LKKIQYTKLVSLFLTGIFVLTFLINYSLESKTFNKQHTDEFKKETTNLILINTSIFDEKEENEEEGLMLLFHLPKKDVLNYSTKGFFATTLSIKYEVYYSTIHTYLKNQVFRL